MVKGVNPCRGLRPGLAHRKHSIMSFVIDVTDPQLGACPCTSGRHAWAIVRGGFGGFHLPRSGNGSPPTLPISSLKGDTQTEV